MFSFSNNKKSIPAINKLEIDNNDSQNSLPSEYIQIIDKGLKEKQQGKPTKKIENNIFNYQLYYEKELIKKQIKELIELIRKEIEVIQKTNQAIISEVKDIANLTLNQQIEKPGIYHVRFLEIVFNLLKQIRAKIGDSKTWLTALLSKKKKRGSLFLSRSKKLGTQYSLSQELQLTRSVQ